ncbi:hypothetical protein SCHPADRAFT_908107 [Schizopora paradoxa]|uniref:Uncharacterized protein n=1 Tax=Schizopora paradoxa TaxID=27342 RepID=A0A0H2RHS6_9AGAM|nr:hypothetical protein SCHPADRAFT_908107 [Schizopora paradoxa]
MNDSVRLLVEKVEACNSDVSSWKPANLRMSRSLSTIPQSPSSPSSESSCSCPRAYGRAIVAELSHLLSRERAAHAETLLAAEQRVTYYEAAIARREADLACVLDACHCGVASALAATFSEFGSDIPEDRMERTLAIEVHNLRGEVQVEKARRNNPRKSMPITPSIPQNAPPVRNPSSPPAVTPPPESDLITLTRQIDSLRAEVLRLSSEKDALQRVVQTEFSSDSPTSTHLPPSESQEERELVLIQENERLREALARAQRHPTSPPSRPRSPSHSLPSPAIHASSVLPPPSTDLFRSPLPDSAAIDKNFPPLTPDLSMSAASTSMHGCSAYDDVESLFPIDLSEVIPLPLSPLLSPLPSLAGPSDSGSGSRSNPRPLFPFPSSLQQTPLDMSLCSDESDESIEGEESPTLRAAQLLRQQREASLEAQLAAEHFEAEAREREMLELREAIASLAVGAGLGAQVVAPNPDPDPIPPPD